jgi:hypothetical protein
MMTARSVSTRVPRAVGRGLVVSTATFLALLVTAGCATDRSLSPAGRGATGNGDGAGPTGPAPSGTAAPSEDAVRIRLTIGDREATATLEDNPVSRDLLSLLPVTVPMGDLFGREKPGPLPRALTGEVEPVFTYRVGQIAYWPPSRDIFVVYEGEGLRVPSPGLVPLGTVDTGLDVIAAAGDDFDMTIAVLD